jgi:hypothetical protein
MDENVIISKLGIKPGTKALFINMPKDLANPLKNTIKQFGIKKSLRGKFDVILCFEKIKSGIQKKAKDIFNSLHDDNSLVWIAYPKKGSNIKTDLNRDILWDVFNRYNYRPVTMVSLNDSWAAVRFRSGEKISKVHQKKKESDEYKKHIDNKKKTVTPPDDLVKAFKTNKSAKKFFDSLSFTHKKEYVDWIISAKREDTRKRRLKSTIEKLNSSIKDPHAK